MKRVLSVLTAAGLALSLAACGSSASSAASSEAAPAAGFDTTQAITVISVRMAPAPAAPSLS